MGSWWLGAVATRPPARAARVDASGKGLVPTVAETEETYPEWTPPRGWCWRRRSHMTRLETRTKEANVAARQWVWKPHSRQ